MKSFILLKIYFCFKQTKNPKILACPYKELKQYTKSYLEAKKKTPKIIRPKSSDETGSLCLSSITRYLLNSREKEKESSIFFKYVKVSVLSDSWLTPWPARLFCPWNSPSENNGVDCHFPLQVFGGSFKEINDLVGYYL